MNTKCQVFTPEFYVNYMLDLIEYKDNLFGKKVLENSFGNGNFLIKIIDRYIANLETSGFKKNEIKNGLENDIYGYEIDKDKYDEAINRINELLLSKGLENTNMHLYNADGLIDYDIEFDYIVGNPPYISYRELNDGKRKELYDKYSTCKRGKFDYCYAFIENSIKYLKCNGFFSYIVPSSILKNVFASELRKLLLDNGLGVIVDEFNDKVFKNANICPVILALKKGFNGSVKVLNIRNNTQNIISRDILYKQDKWILKNERQNIVYNSESLDYHVANSIATLLNKVFVIRNFIELDDEYIKIDDFKIEKNILKSAYSPNSIYRKVKEYIIFPYYYNEKGNVVRYEEEELKNNFPNAYKYLSFYKNELIKRDSDKNAKWYEYGRSQALKYMNSPKALMSILVTKKIKIYYLEKDDIPYSGIYVSIKDEEDFKKVCDKLYSENFFDYIKSIGIKSDGDSFRITCSDVKKFIKGEV